MTNKLFKLLGFCFLVVSALIFLACSEVQAQATGNWVSNTPGEGFIIACWPSTSHYDVEMTLNASGDGSITTTLRSVTDVQPGWEDAYDFIGTVTTDSVSWSGTTSITLGISSVSMQATINGDKMTGHGTYYDDQSGTTYTYTIDLKREGGGGGSGDGGGDVDLSGVTAPAAGAAVVAAAVGLGASLAGSGSVSASWGPELVRLPPLPPPPPPLLNPNLSWPLPVPQTDPDNGTHLVPADAPDQNDRVPENERFSTAPRTCEFCGMMMLSPFIMSTQPPLIVSWRCTNVLCPSRRQILTHGHTTNEFHHCARLGEQPNSRFDPKHRVEPTKIKFSRE